MSIILLPEVIPNQAVKPELDDEINRMAKKIRSTNRIKMTRLKDMPENNQQTSIIKTLSPEILSVDRSSALGQFGWTEFDKTFFPYLIRSGEKYVALGMLENKIFPQYETNEILLCFDVERIKMTKTEAQLLNEINVQHCDNSFGSYNFTDQDDIININDANEMHDFFKFCDGKLAQGSPTPEKRCGFIKVASANCLPYVWWNSKQYVPLFYFEGKCKYLEQRALEIKGWELAYLKLLCKVHGVRKSFFETKPVRMVDLEVIKQCYDPGTTFEETWPAENMTEALLRKRTPYEPRTETADGNNQQKIPCQGAGNTLQLQPSDALGNFNILSATLGHVNPLNSQPSCKITQQKKSVSVRQAPHPYAVANKNYSRLTQSNGRILNQPGILSNNTNQLTATVRGMVQNSAARAYNNRLTAILVPDAKKVAGCRFYQIPDYPCNSYHGIYYLTTHNIGDITLKYCVNLVPNQTDVLLVTVREVSCVLLNNKSHLFKKAIEYLRLNVLLPNALQKTLLRGVGIHTDTNLINVNDIRDNIEKIRKFCSKLP